MKRLLVVFLLLAGTVSYAARGGTDVLQSRQLQSYEDTGYGTTKWLPVLLPSSSTVATILLPSSATGFKLYPITNIVQFEVDKDTTSSLATVNAETTYSTQLITSSFTAGGFAMNDIVENRLLPSGSSRYLHIMPLTVGTTVRIELY